MPKIDTSSWGEFPLIELFDFYLSKGDNQAQKLDEGEIPLVSSGSFNNGICKYIDKGDGISELFEGNLITIDMFGQPFYQNNPFYSVSHGRVNILKPKFHINEYIGLFIVSVLQKMYYEKYGFTTMCSQTKLKKEYIKLPITKDNKPDWQYMEDYMRNIEVRVSDSISKLESAKDIESSKIDVGGWGEFVVSDVCCVLKGRKKLSNINITDLGSTPVYSSTTENNGIIGYTEESPDYVIDTDTSFYIIFGDHTKSMYIATNDFCVMDNVKVLVPKVYNKYAMQFVLASWQKSIPTLGYSRHWSVAEKPFLNFQQTHKVNQIGSTWKNI